MLRYVDKRFAELAGVFPIKVAHNDATLTISDRNRLLDLARHDAGFQKQLRLLHANVHFMDMQFEEAIAQAEDLLLML